MRFEPKTLTLKDGSAAVLRAPRIDDAPVMLDFLLAISTETEFTMRYPEECTLTLAQEEQFIQSRIDGDHCVMLVCEVDGEFAGNCELMLHTFMKTRHRGEIAIALKQKFWGRGIGTAMLSELTAIAKAHGLMQLELVYVDGNDRGRALYEKMGFSLAGKRPDAYRMQDGTLRDECIMIKKL